VTGSTPTSTTSSRELKKDDLGRSFLSPLLLVLFKYSRFVWKIASVLVKFY
jgi:hypothetical protein